MRDRAALYVGILLIAFGGLFLLAQVSSTLPLDIHLGWGTLWPFLILIVGLAFWLAIAVWWDKREQIVGLAMPGTIITTNGLILLYQNLTGDWASWAYLWPLEPVAVGIGLLSLYLLGNRPRGLLVAAGIVGGVGLLFFVIFASAFGGLVGLLGPVVLILIGLLIAVRGIRQGHGQELLRE